MQWEGLDAGPLAVIDPNEPTKVLSWSWGIERTGDILHGSATIVKWMDDTSPVLADAVAAGGPIAGLELAARGLRGQGDIVLDMQHIIITSYEVVDDTTPREHITLAFAEIKVEYQSVGDDAMTAIDDVILVAEVE